MITLGGDPSHYDVEVGILSINIVTHYRHRFSGTKIYIYQFLCSRDNKTYFIKFTQDIVT